MTDILAQPPVQFPGTVKGGAYSASVLTTRPANVTPYVAGAVVGAALAAIEFTDIGGYNGHILITSASLRHDVAALPAGMAGHRLHLYNISPPSALADGAVWDLPAGDREAYLGYIDLGTPVDVGSTLFVQTDNINAQRTLLGTSLFGYVQTIAGYTPASAAVRKIRLRTVAL